MNTTAATLDKCLRDAKIGGAFGIFGSPPYSGLKDGHYVVIHTPYKKRKDLIWFCQSARKFLGNLRIVYRYDDIPEENILKDITFLYAIPVEMAERICKHFTAIASNDTIDPKYLEPSYPDRGDVVFVM